MVVDHPEEYCLSIKFQEPKRLRKCTFHLLPFELIYKSLILESSKPVYIQDEGGM
jgi:hypothetical protein